MSDVEKEFMPWLTDCVETQLSLTIVSRHLLDTVIHDVVRARSERYSQLEAAELIAAQRDERQYDEPVVDTTAADDDQQGARDSLSCDL